MAEKNINLSEQKKILDCSTAGNQMIIPCDKATRALTQIEIPPDKQFDHHKIDKESKNIRDLDDAVFIMTTTKPEPLTINYFDILIYIAIINILLDNTGDMINITIKAIYQRLTYRRTANISARWKESIKNSLEKLGAIKIYYRFMNNPVFDILPQSFKSGETRLINYQMTEISKNIVAYMIAEMPIIAINALLKKHFDKIDCNMLKIYTNDKMQNITTRRTVLIYFILRRVIIIARNSTVSKYIDLNSIMDVIKTTDTDDIFDSCVNLGRTIKPKVKREIKQFIRDILNFWRSEKFIKNYEIAEGPRKEVVGYTIFV